MSATAQTQTPHVATGDAPVPNWGRLVNAGYGSVAWNRRDADEIATTVPHHVVLFSFKPYENRETRLGGTRIRTVSSASGACEIVPAGADYWARWHQAKEVAVFSLSDAWLHRLAQDDLDLPSANVFADGLPVVDQRIAALGRMLREELKSDAGPRMQGLQLDSLLTLVGLHLLRQYGVARPRKDLGGLSDRQLRRLREFMDANLSEGVRLEDMARIAGLSCSQLLRSFKKRTGTSPHQFLIRLRLDRARAMIIDGPLPLADIAIACGFSSQSHLTAFMRREDGLTPGAMRA